MKRIQGWFPTFVYTAPLHRSAAPRFRSELLRECHQLREYDEKGRRWSARNYPGGYTSYGSLDKVHRISSTFLELQSRLNRHVRAFATALEWDLAGRKIEMTDCWVNIMPRRCAHSLHLHPLSVISGTYYVATPRGCPGLKFEDPRLDRFMAAPPRLAGCQPENRPHVVYPAEAGHVILFESWLRHEVTASPVKAERVSISFNYAWA